MKFIPNWCVIIRLTNSKYQNPWCLCYIVYYIKIFIPISESIQPFHSLDLSDSIAHLLCRKTLTTLQFTSKKWAITLKDFKTIQNPLILYLFGFHISKLIFQTFNSLIASFKMWQKIPQRLGYIQRYYYTMVSCSICLLMDNFVMQSSSMWLDLRFNELHFVENLI